MSDQKELKKRLKALMGLAENQVCSDCTERQPRWASLIVPPPGAPEGSLPIGAFCCLECSGSHRRLGVHISFVRSINLDSWKEKEVLAMENGGNAKVNAIFEAHLNREKPTNHADLQTRERYIRDKYERRKFYDPSAFGTYRAAPRAPAQASSQQQEISLPALRPNPVGPPSDVAQRRIEERRRRNKGLSPKEGDRTLRRVGSSDSVKEKSKKSSRNKVKPSNSNASSVSQSSSVDLLDFGSEPPAPAPGNNNASNTDFFGFIEPETSQQSKRTPSETFGNSFFKDASAGGDQKSKSSAAADIMALYGGGGSSSNHNQSSGNTNGFGHQQNFFNGGGGGGQNGMNSMNNQMGQMNLNGQQQQQGNKMWTPQQQQQMMMMQQQQQMMMMMQQQQGQGRGNFGGNFNPQMMNGFNPQQMMGGNMMMATAAANNNGYGNNQMAAPMGSNTGGRTAPQKEDPFASLGGRNTFR